MSEKLFTAFEVAERLRLHVETVYRLIHNGALPALKVGRQWRFAEADLQRWMCDRRKEQPTESMRYQKDGLERGARLTKYPCERSRYVPHKP